MLPVVELCGAHVERLAADLAEIDILRADAELVPRIAHRCGPIAAPAGLMKQKGSVHARELRDHRLSFRRRRYTLDHTGLR